MHHDVVFDSNSADTGNIHTRFYRNHVSQGKLCFLALCQPRVFVNFQSQAMTRAMDEILIQPVGCQYPPGRRVYIT